jgi:hypothetical protein
MTAISSQHENALATKDLSVGFRTNHIVNPLERGHIAFRTDDIEAFKKGSVASLCW